MKYARIILLLSLMRDAILRFYPEDEQLQATAEEILVKVDSLR